MKVTRKYFRHVAAALGLGALSLLGVTSIAEAPAAVTSVQAKAHPAAGPTYVAPQVPHMELGQTEGEPTPTVVTRN